MTPRAPATSLTSVLRRHHRAVRSTLALHAAMRWAAVVTATLALALLAGALVPFGTGAAWLRLGAVAAVIAATAIVLALRVRGRLPHWDGFLEQVEARFPELRSWIRNAVDLAPGPGEHTSAALARALEHEAARRAEATPLVQLHPHLEPARPLLLTGAAAAAVALLVVLAPGPSRRSWTTLWDPAAAAPPARIEVTPGDVRLSPGASLAVRAHVWNSARVPSLVRDADRSPRAVAEGLAPDGSRIYRFELLRISRDDRYRVEVGRVHSPTYTIALAGEPVATSFEVEYQAPRYARLPVQRAASIHGDLSALRGTRARVTATFDRDLDHVDARTEKGRTTAWTAITPRRWQGEVAVLEDGPYWLDATAPRGRASLRYQVTPLPDAPPVLAVRVPSGDVDLPAGQRVSLEVWGTDDLGLTELRLAYRKGEGPWVRVPLQRFGDQPREMHFSGSWDASPLGLLPGDEAGFRLELADNCGLGAPQIAVSQTFLLRFPSLTELYDQLDQHQERSEQTLQNAADKALEIQKSLEKLTRQNEPGPNVSFERQEEMKNTAERQRQLAAQLDDAAKDLQQTLEQASERSAFDEQLLRKMQEMSDLMQQIQSPEFKDAMRKMQEALQRMDKRSLDQSLGDLRDRNQEMMRSLERTLELLRRLRQEEALQSAARRAEELQQRQDERNKEMESHTPKGPSPLAEAHQRDAKESKDLAADLKSMEEQAKAMNDPPTAQELEQSAQALEQEAAPAQQDAASQLQQGQGQQARSSGQRASQGLQKAAQQVHNMQQRMSRQNDQKLQQAVREVGQDLLALSNESDDALDTPGDPRRLAERQRDLREGTARVADSLFSLARQTPFLSEDVVRSLGKAVNQFDQSEREFTRGNRQGGEQSGRSAGEALNQAVLKLRESEQSMCNQPGQGQSAQQSMGMLSQQQSELNQDTHTLAQRLSEVMRLSAGDQAEMERLAARQERIRQGLEELQQREAEKKELLGRLDQVQREMKEAEEIVRRDPTDPNLEERQNRILSRMLDAQRSVNRRDLEPERISRPGEDVVRASPPPLPADVLGASDRARAALLKAEADRYPAQYRAFIEAYLRALNGNAP